MMMLTNTLRKFLRLLTHISEVTQDQIMLRVFPMSLTGAASQWLRNEPSGSIDTWETLKKKFLSKYCPPARTAKKMEEINNFQQVPDETLYQAWEQFKELLLRCLQHYLMDMQGAVDAKKAIQDMDDHSQKWHNETFIDDSNEEKMALVELMDREKSATNLKKLLMEKPRMRTITLRVEDDKIVFKSDNPTSNIIKRISRPRVWDLNEPLELRRNQVEDLGLKIEEGEVIDEPMEDIVKTRNDDNEISNGIDEYPSFCDFDRKIHINCAYNLQFSCMI
ncbi:reverse transcriptase domain-containing protein, partial [Tanacetum coccineum]